MFQKRHDHSLTENKYKLFRNTTYEIVMEEFPGITARGINLRTAYLADSWSEISDPNARRNRGKWEWAKEFPYYQNRPNRFEISLWKGNELGALCYGVTSVRGTRVRMNLIESTPIRPSPLGMKALPALSFSAIAFANLVGAEELWVLDPDPYLERYYEKAGFSSMTTYHGKRVGQRRVL